MNTSVEPSPQVASPSPELAGDTFKRPWPVSRVADFCRPETLFFLILLLALLAAGRSAMLQDPGVFWHTVLGERLLETGDWTHEDAFTFTFAGKPWLDLQWLGGLAMTLMWRIGGWDALLLAACVFLAGAYTWLANRLLRAGFKGLPTSAILLVVLAASSHHFHVRPHLASIFFLGLTYAWLTDVESRRSSVQKLWLLIPLFVLWANVHGGVLAAWGTLVLAAGGWTAARWLKLPCPLAGAGEWLTLAGVMLAAPLAFLVNPYGIAAPEAWLSILRMPLPAMIQEHRPLDFSEPIALMVLALAAGYFALLREAVTCRMDFCGSTGARGFARLRRLCGGCPRDMVATVGVAGVGGNPRAARAAVCHRGGVGHRRHGASNPLCQVVGAKRFVPAA